MISGAQHNGNGRDGAELDAETPSIKTITQDGDLILEYIAPGEAPSTNSRKWQVASQLLTSNSPYFQALLDPAKFSEGRQFNTQKQAWSESQTPNVISHHALPTVTLPAVQPTIMCGEDAIDLFLRILCLDSMVETERTIFENNLKFQSTSLIARLIDLADSFNSPRIVRDILQRVSYSYGKAKYNPILKFHSGLLSIKEDRIRQIIFISTFLGDSRVTRVMSHVLILVGSKFWMYGLEGPEEEDLRWKFLPNGLEEEIYRRRQFVLNTITDLQAHFLRIYGGMEDIGNAKPVTTNRSLGAAFTASAATLLHSRQFQCRGGFNNASQCDLFQLGQMIRFFSMRAKTVFLGSTLIDPDFSTTPENEHSTENKNDQSPGPASDITAIISSLKQYPDYPIDEAHSGCGVRRRIMPALECVEKFAWDERGLLGITPAVSGSESSPSMKWMAWTDLLHRKHMVDISFARVTAVYYPAAPSKNQVTRSTPQDELAQLLFTAARRDWTAAGSG